MLLFNTQLPLPGPPPSSALQLPPGGLQGVHVSVCVWLCVNMHMQCVCVACGGECVGGLWGVWMGHGVVVADSPHPHHGHLWCVLVEVVGGSGDECCGCVRMCESGAAASAGVGRSSASSPVICGALQPPRIRPPPWHCRPSCY